MPPKGLYSMGRHHLYGGQMARRSFNSNDFQTVPKPEKPTEAGIAAGQTLDGANDTAREGERQRKEKKKKKRKSLSEETGQDASGAIQSLTATPNVSESKKKRKKAKKEEAGAIQQLQTSEGRKKKRKRESEAYVETPTAVYDNIANSSFVVGEDLVDNVMASLNGLVAPGTQSFETPQTPEKPSKRKKKKSSRKSQDVHGDDHQTHGEIVEDGEAPNADKSKEKKHKKRKNKTAQQQDDKPLSTTTTPRKTPIPPPQLSQLPSTNSAVLVPETPPSKAASKVKLQWKSPVPFPQLGSARDTTRQRKPSRKESVTVLLSTPTSVGDARTPKSAPSVPTNGISRPSVPNALTGANLSKHTRPSLKEAKPKPRSRRAVSTVTSQPESSSTPSIIDAFARISKPYTRSGAEVDPFVLPEAKVKECREIHQEASMNVFNEKFHDLQKAVNFSEELSYLEQSIAWDVDNASNQLPCLGTVTGCTAKKEEILRLSKEEDLNILRHLDTEGGDLDVLKDATDQARLADELLMLSLKARVPVPIGRLEGIWTLYCPKYAETHFDRYGYGQRTLTISSIAGFKHQNSYTARLNIPPRSMSYSILAFSTPPHASFRTTTVKTAAEGYTMDIVFLGNGYLQLRVDLNLLLKGKATGEVEGRKVHMEFIGVHEKAVKWFEKRNELEEEAKKLFAKYDGGGDE